MMYSAHLHAQNKLISSSGPGPCPKRGEVGALTALTELDLFENAITSLPAKIGTLRSLAELYVRDNPISEPPTGLGAPPDHPGVVGDLSRQLSRALQRRRAGGAEAGIAASCSRLLFAH